MSLVCGQFADSLCPRPMLVPGLFETETCSRMGPGCDRACVRGLFADCSRTVHGLFKDCSRTLTVRGHGQIQSADCSRPDRGREKASVLAMEH